MQVKNGKGAEFQVKARKTLPNRGMAGARSPRSPRARGCATSSHPTGFHRRAMVVCILGLL